MTQQAVGDALGGSEPEGLHDAVDVAIVARPGHANDVWAIFDE